MRVWVLLFLTGCVTWTDEPSGMRCVSDMQDCREACVWTHEGFHASYWTFTRPECRDRDH